jgi:hypothetical protein
MKHDHSREDSMKAVVFTGQGEVLRDVPEPSPNADEVLISVEYCGICGSDLHAATVPVESAIDAFAAMRSSTSAVKFLIGAGA